MFLYDVGAVNGVLIKYLITPDCVHAEITTHTKLLGYCLIIERDDVTHLTP